MERTQQALVLQEEFDPDRLGSGLYVSASNSPAYAIALAMVAFKQAKLLGEKYEAGGAKVVTIRLGNGSLRPNVAGRIRIGRSFFVTALRDYQNWREKWWRECVQNSVDAGAKNISLACVQNDDGTWTASCEDDGRGMDEDTLITKFLELGGTTKEGASSTAGGFGKAKELLILPWLEWRISTRGVEIIGTGDDYDKKFVEGGPGSGTFIAVKMPDDNHTTPEHAAEYLSMCNLPGVKFSVNGNPVKANLRSGALVEEFGDKAGVYHNKSTGVRGFFVRVRGLCMYEEYQSSEIPGAVIVEIERPSTEILTANRDGIRDDDLRRSIGMLKERISKDVRSALKSKKGLIRERFSAGGALDVKGKQAELLLAIPPLPLMKRPLALSGDVIAKLAFTTGGMNAGDMSVGAAAGTVVEHIMSGIRIRGQHDLEAALRQLVWKPDFYLVNEIENYHVPKRYYPGTMTPTIFRLAKIWAELCRFVLIQLHSDSPYGVGFVFSEDVAAQAIEEEDNTQWLMLNPHAHLTERREVEIGLGREAEVLHVSDPRSLRWLYAAAVHEATHIADGMSYHDERFSSAMTRNMALCAEGFSAAKKIASSIKLRSQIVEPEPPKERWIEKMGTHTIVDGVARQIASAQTLRDVCYASGVSFERPDDFGPLDEWNVKKTDSP